MREPLEKPPLTEKPPLPKPTPTFIPEVLVTDDVPEQLEKLASAGTPRETIAMLQEVYEEHPDAVSIVVSLLESGWTIVPTGEGVICVTLRSPAGDHEVLGHGTNILDAFEDIQRKTKSFSKLLSGVEAQ